MGLDSATIESLGAEVAERANTTALALVVKLSSQTSISYRLSWV